MLQVVGGCRSSFQQLHQRTSVGLFALTLRLSGNAAEAEDWLQDSYIKVWRDCQRFDPARGSALTWMTAVARHTAIDGIKRRQARPKLASRPATVDVDDDDPFAMFPSPEPGPLEHAQAQQQMNAVRGRMQMLPAEERQSLCLAYYNGLSHSEIAAHLDRPLGTVKSWIRRSLSVLQLELQGPF